MKRKLCKLLAGVLCMQTFAGVTLPVGAREVGEHIVIAQLPGTVVEEKSYDDSFLNITGYVEEGVSDRSAYYWEYVEINQTLEKQWIADGNKEEDYVWQNTDNYYVANNEQELCDALASDAKVIEITVDMELGYKYLAEQEIDTHGAISQASDYEKGNEPISSPDLIEKGVSKMSLTNKDGLTIFSRNGSTLYHCEIGITRCNDIVIRNIGIQGLNEWDDLKFNMAGTPGYHKRYDWDNISIFASTNVWIDHCTMGIAYDGSIDTTDGSTATVTWCEIGVPDEKLLQEMQNTMDYQEELYTQGKANQFYTALRDGGASKEQIFKFSLLNDKVQLIGANDTNYDVNIKDRSTIAYNFYKNAVQRVPQIISGNAHMFNCWIDSNDYRAIHEELSNPEIGTKTDANGNKISPMAYAASKGCSTLGLCRANSARNGGTIGTDTCVFEGVIDPIIGEEVQSDNINDTGILSGAVNHNLIVNSSSTDYGKENYIGSSWDNNGVNGFVGEGYWNGNRCSINKFQWADWKSITKNPDEESDSVIYLPEKEANKLIYGEFYNKFYIGSDTLGYEYQIVPLEEVKTTVASYSGCGKIDLSCADWTATQKNLTPETYKVTFSYDMYGVKDTVVDSVSADSVVSMPAFMEMEGYNFANWYTKEYYVDDAGEVQYKEVVFDENTKITKDTLVFAKWTKKNFTVTLELNGGTTQQPSEYILAYNSMFFLTKLTSATVTKEGYTLAGWYSDEALTSRAYYLQVKDDATLYAKWDEVVKTPEPAVSEEPSLQESSEPGESTVPSVSGEPMESKEPLISAEPGDSIEPVTSGEPMESNTPGLEESESPVYELGDVDGSGSVELKDAQLALRAALLLDELNAPNEKAADYNGDGFVQLDDAQKILRKALLLPV